MSCCGGNKVKKADSAFLAVNAPQIENPTYTINERDEVVIRCLVIGLPRVGKSTFIRKILDPQHSIEGANAATQPTQEPTETDYVPVNNIIFRDKKVVVKFMDTVGQNAFNGNMPASYAKNPNIVIALFDATHFDTSIEGLKRQIAMLQSKLRASVIYVFGTKMDILRAGGMVELNSYVDAVGVMAKTIKTSFPLLHIFLQEIISAKVYEQNSEDAIRQIFERTLGNYVELIKASAEEQKL